VKALESPPRRPAPSAISAKRDLHFATGTKAGKMNKIAEQLQKTFKFMQQSS
jgi:hypothetical protein